MARAMRGYTAFNIAEQGCWLAILLWAFELGGVAEAGRAAIVLLLPAILLTPLLGMAGDHFRRDRVLTVAFVATGVFACATGLLMLAEAPTWSVYATAAVFSVLLSFVPPAMAAAIPSVARSADELTAANVATGFLETVGRLAGPAAAGALLWNGSPGTVNVVLGIVAIVGGLASIGTVEAPRDERHADDPESAGTFTEFAAGVRLLRSEPRVRSLMYVLLTTKVVAGALDVGAAALATEALRRSEATTSVLVTGFGVGSAVGSVGTVLLIGRRRLGRAVVVGVVLMSVAFGTLGIWSSLAVALAALLIVGGGVAITSVAVRTMLQGLAPDDTLARLFGVVESLKVLALAIGGVIIAVVGSQYGLVEAFAAVGVVSLSVLTWSMRRLREIDAERRPIDLTALALARSTPVFGPLPVYALEQVLCSFVHERFEPGVRLFTRGEVGDTMLLIASGSVTVHLESGEIRRRHAGDLIGELAVLHGGPRSADVVAGEEGVDVYWMDSEAFVRAVNQVPRSHARVHAEARRRLQN